jgi:uncharacterized protein (DUF433 family)
MAVDVALALLQRQGHGHAERTRLVWLHGSGTGSPRVSGAWVFRGTRILVVALFETLEDGSSLADFVELFPGVTPEQARSVLEHAARSTAAKPVQPC